MERATIQKHYFYDNGILGLFIINPDTRLLENLVALHLFKKYGERLQYYSRNVEVDFIVASELLLVQASWSIGNPDTRQREVNALVRTAHRINATQGCIVTFNEDETMEVGGVTIVVVPVYKWLLDGEG